MRDELKRLFWGTVHTTLKAYYNGAKKGVPEISVEETHRLLEKGREVVLLDVREKEEVALGYIKGAVFVPRSLLVEKAKTLLPQTDIPIIVYCAAGLRSRLAAQTLQKMGYAQVFSMAKGINGWKAAGYEVANDSELTLDQLTRYSRNLLLEEVGLEGQVQLMKARVLLVGAGGLGCPAGLYLAAAGVGTLGVIDSDRVDLTNLQRQILHTTSDVGRPKTESAKEAIGRINPDIQVITYQERLTAQNALDIFRGYDIIVDGADNFPTKYLVNDASFFTEKAYVYGGVLRFEGQASVFSPKKGGPCLRCLFPEPPPPGLVPTWDEAGVLGVVPGIIGLIQATEVLKFILNRGKPLAGRFLIYDSLESDFQVLSVEKNSSCPLCGQEPRIKGLIDYHDECSLSCGGQPSV